MKAEVADDWLDNYNTSKRNDIFEGAGRTAKERQVTIHREPDNMRKDGSAVQDGVFSIVGDYKDQ